MPCIAEVETMEMLYLFLFTFWMIYLYFVQNYGYWEQRAVPHVPAVFPMGSLTKVVISSKYDETMLDKIYKDFKEHRFVGFINIREPCLLVRDPGLVKNVMSDNFDHFMDRGWLDVNPKDYLVSCMITRTGKDWERIHKKLTPAYSDVYWSASSNVFRQSCNLLLNTVEEQTEQTKHLEVIDILSRFTMDVFNACVFGTDDKSEDDEFFKVCRKAMNTDFRVKLKLFVYFAFPIVSRHHMFDMVDQEVGDAFKAKVRTVVESRENSDTKTCDFINELVRVRRYESVLRGCPNSAKENMMNGLTVEDIISETFGFLAVGQEKTSVTAQYCLYEIARDEQIQERIFQEVQDIFNKHSEALKFSKDLDAMPYLSQVVNETLRHYPIFPATYRKCTRNFRIPDSNLVVEEGLRLMIPTFSIHHDSKYFPDPYSFDPERFSALNRRGMHPGVFLPFGIGPRKCVGYRFGVTTVKLAVARLVHDFHIKLSPDTPVPLQFTNESYMTKPLTPIKLMFTRR